MEDVRGDLFIMSVYSDNYRLIDWSDLKVTSNKPREIK